ncbi:MAG: response regulator transcription factor [Cyanobacteriota/Melainabacteria group bacterium]
MAKLLVVEDDENLVKELEELLGKEQHTVDTAGDGISAQEMLQNFVYELVVLDVNIPEMNGIDLCAWFRQNGGATPVLMLTGMSTISDKEKGLDSGADDYLTKPFSARELMARIRALLRRSPVISSGQLRHRDLVVELSTKTVSRSGEEIKLWAREYDVLVFLLKNVNHIFDADALIARVWPMESEVSPEAIRQCVRRLREKVDQEGEPSYVTTIKGFGYTIKED